MTETIKINIDDQQLTAYLQKLQTQLADMSPVMERAASVMAGAVDRNFAAGGRPAWHPLTKAYANRKKKEGFGDKILIRTGRLRTSITQQHGPDFALVGTMKEYAAIHQFGGNITTPPHRRKLFFRIDHATGKKGRFVTESEANYGQMVNHPGNRNMPARPYLKLDITDLETIRLLVQQMIKNPP
ncbi:MAG: phage virion morphogenesis protein [Magnetococcales bacterium]|nr:phage virion morphogenesis protein [Magnetococcales bacterium]